MKSYLIAIAILFLCAPSYGQTEEKVGKTPDAFTQSLTSIKDQLSNNFVLLSSADFSENSNLTAISMNVKELSAIVERYELLKEAGVRTVHYIEAMGKDKKDVNLTATKIALNNFQVDDKIYSNLLCEHIEERSVLTKGNEQFFYTNDYFIVLDAEKKLIATITFGVLRCNALALKARSIEWPVSNLSKKSSPLTGTEFSVVPNPASNKIAVDLKMPSAADGAITITDLAGKMIRQIPFSSSPAGDVHTEIDVADLPAGSYNITASAQQFKQGTMLLISK